MDLSVVALFMLVLVSHGARLDDKCPVERCAKDGPAIRFPFRLKDKNELDHCSYPGFELSCTDRKQTLLQLPNFVKLYVDKIDYASQLIIARDPDECLPSQLRHFSLSGSPFESGYMELSNYSFFNCTSRKGDGYENWYLDCLSGPGYNIYAYTSDNSISYTDLTNCTKLYNLSSVPSETFEMKNTLHLNWSTPHSGLCEQQGKFCRRNSNATGQTECYDKPKSKKDIEKKIEAAVATVARRNANLPGRSLHPALEVISEAE
ncbi:RING-H2 FINGER PROTEIN ATL21A-RELATED [Salix koriyanagi]|uniref:RING-type E3 ubiquitin transferase n=1 Tax=Salix koriyanagi TaxID=2511006 RepID=A0A9Q0PGA1_9ROSI|nr:RING-H2 FINGER PROTEIN ATL21A-RELATED [Salix koriyanagi]